MTVILNQESLTLGTIYRELVFDRLKENVTGTFLVRNDVAMNELVLRQAYIYVSCCSRFQRTGSAL